jgi:hypothetical protein
VTARQQWLGIALLMRPVIFLAIVGAGMVLSRWKKPDRERLDEDT